MSDTVKAQRAGAQQSAAALPQGDSRNYVSEDLTGGPYPDFPAFEYAAGLFTSPDPKTVVAPDGTEYRFLANEGILCHVGELEFQGSVEGAAEKPDYPGASSRAGMFAVKGDVEQNILIRVFPDSEWYGIYRKASLPELDVSVDNCSRMVFVSLRQLYSAPDEQLFRGNGITDPEEIRAFLSDLRAQPDPIEAGLYDLITQEDGRLLNCYEPGAICCFFDEEPLVFVPLYVTSYNDLAWSVRLDGAAHVLPERWRALLDPCDPSQLVLFHTAADRFHRAMGEDSPILYIRCEDTSAPAAEP